ncbi:MAG TPA: heliorhodopsin HeR [Thermomicrobiaceae bacterium]|nr:heliorhodopsin HeR [Thermomicrobiaceae bacterium]
MSGDAAIVRHGATGARGIAPESTLPRLRRYNLIVGLVHLAQAAVIFALSNDFALPITAGFLGGPPGSAFTARETLWKVPIGYAVGFFLLLAAADHLLMAAPGIWPWYRDNLARNINYARWWEYAISASVMIVLIALVTGVSDVGALIAIFGINAAMIFFGMLMEIFNRPGEGQRVNWTPFIFGCVAGVVPWIVIAYQFFGAESRAPAGAGVPGFVYGIVISLFVLFNTFAVNQALQYGRVGPWRSYLFGEKAYIVLSLSAKTLLAWQIFANTLIR